MAIDTSLSPYYDDFDEDKGFHRLLFRPARAVQARELTQTEVYRGPDSRKGERRSFTDPRQEVRYEPGKKDRRQNPGRRKEDKEVQKRPWQFWI